MFKINNVNVFQHKTEQSEQQSHTKKEEKKRTTAIDHFLNTMYHTLREAFHSVSQSMI